jgi:hypothetical protein
MKHHPLHISDVDLLLEADGELSRRRGGQIRAHLAECWSCRARRVELEDTIAHFVRAHEASLDGELPSDDSGRAMLAARLRRLGESGNAPGLQSPFRGLSAQFAFGCLAVALLLTGVGIWKIYRTDTASAAINWRAVPDRNLTPGATRSVAARDVCASAPRQDWAVAATVKKRVLQEYGMDRAQAHSYELDYLITPELGGANDIRNLWPEPYSSTAWNAHVKDELEDRLHTMVCAGQVDLPSAQRDIANNWIAAYKKYFHTDKPISGAST